MNQQPPCPWPDRVGKIAVLKTECSDDDLITLMRRMERDGLVPYLCMVDGWDHDPRFLHQIPDFVELCRRCVRVGLISQMLPNLPNSEESKLGAIGAFDFWAVANSHAQVIDGLVCIRMTKELLQRFKQALQLANHRCAAVCGQPATGTN